MDLTPIEWYDHAVDTRERKILTPEQSGVPGLRMIGYQSSARATAPLPPHYHRDCFEFTYLVRGNLTFHVGNERYPLSGGELFITRPDEIHDTENAPLSLHQMYWFQLDTGRQGFLSTSDTFARQLTRNLLTLDTRVVRMDGGCEGLLRTAFSDLTEGGQLGALRAGALLTASLCQILHDAGMPGSPVTADIQAAADYIRQHIQERISIEELADTASLSVSRFKEKFKAQMGVSPRNYVNYHKIEAAKALLTQGFNVTQTAMALGFSGSDYFSVVFRRYTLLSPTEYQRSCRSG